MVIGMVPLVATGVTLWAGGSAPFCSNVKFKGALGTMSSGEVETNKVTVTLVVEGVKPGANTCTLQLYGVALAGRLAAVL